MKVMNGYVVYIAEVYQSIWTDLPTTRGHINVERGAVRLSEPKVDRAKR